MTYTNQQLKQTLAKMLPEAVEFDAPFNRFHWKTDDQIHWPEIRDTELLHLCWLVEGTLDEEKCRAYNESLCKLVIPLKSLFPPFPEKPAPQWLFNASWQQRTIALAKVKGIEITPPTPA